MKKLLPAVLFLLCLGFSATAQQRPQFSQYSLNNFLVNPAITGIENYMDVKVGLRKQWAGLEGAPLTYYTSMHTSLNKEDKNRLSRARGNSRRYQTKVNRNNKFHRARPHHGLGALAQADRTGPLQNTTLNLTYAFHLPVTNSVTVAMGAAGGIHQFGINRTYVTTVQQNDPALMGDRINAVRMDLGMGLWVYSQDFFAGVSAMQLLNNQTSATTTHAFDQPGLAQPHFYLTGGYRFDVNRDLTLVPSVMLKVARPSVAPDLNLKAILAERVWTGVSYRHQDAVSVMAGINISTLLDLSYSYDAITSELRHASSGSHEFVVGLKLQNRGKAICPQWMW